MRAADLLADGVLIVVRRVVDDPPVAADVDCDAGHVHTLTRGGQVRVVAVVVHHVVRAEMGARPLPRDTGEMQGRYKGDIREI